MQGGSLTKFMVFMVSRFSDSTTRKGEAKLLQGFLVDLLGCDILDLALINVWAKTRTVSLLA